MCLGLTGRVVEAGDTDLARVDVAGVVRDINVALLEPRPRGGDYILIHSGFALEYMTEQEARDAMTVFGHGS